MITGNARFALYLARLELEHLGDTFGRLGQATRDLGRSMLALGEIPQDDLDEPEEQMFEG